MFINMRYRFKLEEPKALNAPKLLALEVRDKIIWNEAIEAAASLNNALTSHQKNNIRKLKK